MKPFLSFPSITNNIFSTVLYSGNVFLKNHYGQKSGGSCWLEQNFQEKFTGVAFFLVGNNSKKQFKEKFGFACVMEN